MTKQNTRKKTAMENTESQPRDIIDTSKIPRSIKITIGVVLILLGLSIATLLGLGFTTPKNISQPQITHDHFRLQVMVDGQSADFSKAPYQVADKSDVCSGGLTQNPIHFHDDRGEIVHLHWQSLTPAQFLKYYGLNTIGGPDNFMGFEQNTFPWKPVWIHASGFPKPQNGDQYFVYKRNLKALEIDKLSTDDLKKKSINSLFGTEDSLATAADKGTAIDGFMGDMVVWVQKDAPSQDDINKAFASFKESDLGSCSG